VLSNTVVLVKQVLDPERKAPPAEVGPELIGPFEQSALEVALQLKDAGATEKLTAIVAGPPASEEALRKALSVRVDEAVRVDTAGADRLDASQTAELLVRAIRSLDSVDLVLAGRQAGDWDQGQVGSLVSERLGWPCVGLVQRAALEDGRVTAWREIAAGEEVLSVRPPALLTVTNADSNRLRMARVMDLMAASKLPIVDLGLAELGLDPDQLEAARRIELVDVQVPHSERECELVEGEGAAEIAAALVDRLEERKLLGGPR
jgi:electron transfer flavoprotein beta subunit